jgi:chitin disaccharide deacetylase
MPRPFRGLTRLAVVTLWTPVHIAAQTPARTELLVRIDDIGMNHSVNMALQQLADTHMPLSASVLFVCPWYQEAVDILHRNPQISVGVHLALNSEWKGYRWGPVLGKEAVPTLVDSVGYFTSSTQQFLALRYDLGQVERELSAQVERALRSGLRIDYVDYHMGTAVATPELRAVLERVANKYGLGISDYFGEAYHTMFDTPIAEKEPAFLSYLRGLAPGSLNLVEVHVGRATPELSALVDLNNPAQNTASGEPLMSRHRQAELDMLLSPEFARLREARGIALLTYADVITRVGRSAMRRPQ